MGTRSLIAHPFPTLPPTWAPVLPRSRHRLVGEDLTVPSPGLVHAPDGSGVKLAAMMVFHAGDPEQAERRVRP